MLLISRRSSRGLSGSFGKFQSRNRDASNFKRAFLRCKGERYLFLFQSRNRDASNFKHHITKRYPLDAAVFQSRNRDASNFKQTHAKRVSPHHESFNLGIEMLLISSPCGCEASVPVSYKFQSRNRDASNFKWRRFRRVRGRTTVSISESRCF